MHCAPEQRRQDRADMSNRVLLEARAHQEPEWAAAILRVVACPESDRWQAVIDPFETFELLQFGRIECPHRTPNRPFGRCIWYQ